ncbi:hypothetical protein LK994_12930 [Ferruginibacter lapsinanis]|uniref:hypothetical protein n=1 Tax=Ferruginibacter lapsinanis TaxID=563172 RepID=UPI001E28C627|nr:hypothetical protein [Ferruginibacter lapsinanis]UEG49538.1 hypothetical protein LK994_12930 [Ferruginibacter lapsinanis]
MKFIPILAFLYMLASCNGGPQSLDEVISEDSLNTKEAKQYPDSVIQNEQNKAIGSIKFGISEEEYQIEKKQFQAETNKQQNINNTIIDRYYIGNFEYTDIHDYFDSGKLYRLEIMGAPIAWDSYDTEIYNRIAAIQELIFQKFGAPDSDNRIPKIDDMKKSSTYLIRTWNIGDKSIEIRVAYNQTTYTPYIAIYKPSVQFRIHMENSTKRDSTTKAGKDLF